jgi:type IV secretory pathway TrbD component
MNLALRAKAMLTDPFAEWKAIDREPGDPAYLLSRYVAVLALIPAASSFVGTSLIGVVVADGATLRTPVFNGLFGAVFGYVVSCVTVLLLGLLINLLAISTVRSSSRSIPSRRSGSPAYSCCCRDCAFWCSPAFTALTSSGSACRF